MVTFSPPLEKNQVRNGRRGQQCCSSWKASRQRPESGEMAAVPTSLPLTVTLHSWLQWRLLWISLSIPSALHRLPASLTGGLGYWRVLWLPGHVLMERLPSSRVGIKSRASCPPILCTVGDSSRIRLGMGYWTTKKLNNWHSTPRCAHVCTLQMRVTKATSG